MRLAQGGKEKEPDNFPRLSNREDDAGTRAPKSLRCAAALEDRRQTIGDMCILEYS